MDARVLPKNGLKIIMLDTTLSISTRGSEQKGLGE